MKLNEKEMIELGNFLAEKRKEKGYTLEELRLKLQSKGLIIEKSDIQRIENAERKLPNPILLCHLANIYEFDIIEVYKKIGYLPKKEKKIIYNSVEGTKHEVMIEDNRENYAVILEHNEDTQQVKIYSSLAIALGKFSNVENSNEYIISLPISELNLDNKIIGVKEKNNKITVIKKDEEVKNNELGVFYFNKTWIIAVKKVSNREEIFLIDSKKDCPIYVRETDNFKEMGKVICEINML